MKPTFESTADGLEIIDRIERHRYRLTTHKPVSIEPVECDQIPYPVDTAVRITTDTITLPTNHYVYVRDKDGSMFTEIRPDQQVSLPRGKYTLDLSGPVKVYAQIDSSVQVYSDSQYTHIAFGDVSSVIIGARSYHTRPARTITTTSDPVDVMQAVSAFGSALKTTTPDRSFPTLRGHPPALEKGEKLGIPDQLEKSNTGIQIEVPPTLDHIYTVSPLAYYLGADVVSNSDPRIVTERGYNYALDREEGFGPTVKQVLMNMFFLDCVVRTEGISPLPLHKLDAIKSHLEFDLKSVYEKMLSKRIEYYLEVPFSEIQSYLPDWQLEVRLKPQEEYLPFLPFVANNLAFVNIQDTSQRTKPDYNNQAQAISEFTRSNYIPEETIIRGSEQISDYKDKLDSRSIDQIWKGEGSNIVSTTPLSAFKNSIGRSPREDPIEIEVICNDSSMSEELESADEAYGDREKLPFEVNFHHDVTVDNFINVLSRKSDFLHYIGHIDSEGFQCADGKLNGKEIEIVNAKAFLLNACQSRNQGLHLINAGSIGGIVTLGDVVNSGAVKIGSTIAQLLNQGFPLYGALDMAQNESVVSQQYLMVGDGRTTIAQAETGVPNGCIIQRSEELSVEVKMYDSVRAGRGTLFTPYLDSVDSYYIVPGNTGKINVEKSRLRKFFDKGKFPVVIDESIHWSDNIDTIFSK